MSYFFVDCPTGLAGDMLLAGLLDLGVPCETINKTLDQIGLANAYQLKVEESSSFGLRGLKVVIENNESPPPVRSWKDIRYVISNSSLEGNLKNKIISVFQLIAEAESSVHGVNIDNIHFHEIGAIDSIVDIVGVCSAFEYLKPHRILCSIPPSGHGNILTSHGILPIPAPAVLELAKRAKINLLDGKDYPECELTTPTGLALMAVLAEEFCRTSLIGIKGVGIGLGHKDLDRPNLLRIIELSKIEDFPPNEFDANPYLQTIILQEAWIDDASPEDISSLIDRLRLGGAIDVVCESVQMKKGRQGVSLCAIVLPEKSNLIRDIWFTAGTTLGLRQREEYRWILPRRKGSCQTAFGSILVKQVKRPDGRITIKVEHDDLIRVGKDFDKTLEEVRHEVLRNSESFIPLENWRFN